MKIEIWSDVVCPWCYIGKRRMERALEDSAEDVEVVWRSFELDPSAPTEPIDRLDEALAVKYGTTLEEARGMMDRMTQVAADEGLDLRFDLARRGNTFDAHRLLHFAAARDLQPAMKERLFQAYMTEGRAISDREDLARLAGEVGLDTDEVHAMLASDELAAEVRRDQALARTLGIQGVPFFVFDGRLAVSGAQPPEVFASALRQAREG